MQPSPGHAMGLVRSPLWRAGAIVSGRYRLRAPIGAGAMGEVWRAEHVTLGTDVAVKLVDTTNRDDAEETLARFQREARAAAQLKSPHVVQILDYGVDGRRRRTSPWSSSRARASAAARRRGCAPALRGGAHRPRDGARHGAAPTPPASSTATSSRHNIFLVRDDDDGGRQGARLRHRRRSARTAGRSTLRDPGGRGGRDARVHEPGAGAWARPSTTDPTSGPLAVIAFECVTGRLPLR